jgi:hypothetical protein
MKTRNYAITAGVLFITATLAGVVSVVLSDPIFKSTDLLAAVADGETRVILGALLGVVMGVCCAGIAIALYPVLRVKNPAFALGSVIFRALEGGMFILCAAVMLTIVSVAKLSAAGSSSDLAMIGSVLHAFHLWVASGIGAIAFCLGAFLYYVVFYRSRLIPRWLSIWGILAILLHLSTIIMFIFGTASYDTFSTYMNLPIFLQELVLAGWLIVKGFNPVALTNQVD